MYTLIYIYRNIHIYYFFAPQVNANKTEFLHSKQEAIFILNGKPLKLVHQFTYLSSNISFTERDINIPLVKARTTIDRYSVIWKSDQFNKTKTELLSSYLQTTV